MYYSMVHTYHIHGSDTYVHVYARWVGFQMLAARLATRLKAKEAASNRLSSTCVFGCHAASKKSQVISGISLAARLTG